LSVFPGGVYVGAMSVSASAYRPRDAEHAVLYRVIDQHLDTFLETARRHADGAALPDFVEQEFRDFLTCGVLAHGFARLRCPDCALERRVQRLLERRGLDPENADVFRADPVAEASPALAGISSASIQGRIALGARAGARVWRVGADPDAPWVLSTAPRHAHLSGFDLHANVDAPAADRARLEQLCRYLLRPAVAQDRLRRLDDGRIVLTL
jgi:hypothetical protein